jgi:hypothetical protein
LKAGGWSMGLMKRFGKMAGFQFIQELSGPRFIDGQPP